MMDRIRQLTALGIFGVLFCALLFGLGPSLSARLSLANRRKDLGRVRTRLAL